MAEQKHIVIKHKTSQKSGGAAHPKVVNARPAVPPVLRKKKGNGSAIAVGVVMALVVLVAGGLLYNVYRQQQREMRIEALALLELKKQSQALYERLPDTVAKMDGFLEQADNVAEEVATITEFVTNRVVDASAAVAGAVVPPHDAALKAIARDLAAGRETLGGIQMQIMDWLSMADTKYDVILKAYSRAVAAPAGVEIEKHLQSIDGLLGEARATLQQMETKVPEAEGIKKKEIRLREARAEAQRRKREAEALQRLSESEVRQVPELVNQSKASIRRFAFGEALEAMERALAGFSTAPGREALSLPVERLQRLQAFKTHLIDTLNNSPYRWGWGMTAADSQDITGADEAGLKITTGQVEWKDVPMPQLMKIIDYVGKTAQRRSSELADDYIATAILLEEFGMQQQACERVAEAIAISRLMAPAARRLLPGCK